MRRTDGYAPIRDYALIGDGRTGALVARDGSIDWLCLPNVDSPAVFGALLDPERGGAFRLGPSEPFESERRYLPATNVLETTFRTASGSVRVTDAMTLTDTRVLGPMREVVRAVEGLTGRVRLEWRFEPQCGFGGWRTRLAQCGGWWLASARRDAVGLRTWDAGEPEHVPDAVEGTFDVEGGGRALLVISASHQEPLVLPSREEALERLERTERFWARWSGRAEYDGAWRELVLRSALALKLLVYSPSGAIVAAPTTSLPERIGGDRNWDYRYAWLRDATHAVEALVRLGYHDEAEAFFWWLMHATRITQPRLQVAYRIDGSHNLPERELDALSGYRDSRPVRVGNAAAEQVQLDVYGSVLDSAWLYADQVRALDRATAKDVAKIADYVACVWERRDSGIWEARGEERHFTQSKALCCVALGRAIQMAERGMIPDRSREWRDAAERIREFLAERCWDEGRRSYVAADDLREVDASLLTLSVLEYDDPEDARVRGTVDAVRRELSAGGPLVYRNRGEEGVASGEGAFLACSFWLVDALARDGRVDEAAELMDELTGVANDVGLFAEEVDPESGEFLGNFPLALTHESLVNAAISIADRETGR